MFLKTITNMKLKDHLNLSIEMGNKSTRNISILGKSLSKAVFNYNFSSLGFYMAGIDNVSLF